MGKLYFSQFHRCCAGAARFANTCSLLQDRGPTLCESLHQREHRLSALRASSGQPDAALHLQLPIALQRLVLPVHEHVGGQRRVSLVHGSDPNFHGRDQWVWDVPEGHFSVRRAVLFSAAHQHGQQSSVGYPIVGRGFLDSTAKPQPGCTNGCSAVHHEPDQLYPSLFGQPDRGVRACFRRTDSKLYPYTDAQGDSASPHS